MSKIGTLPFGYNSLFLKNKLTQPITQKILATTLALNVALFVKAFFDGANLLVLSGFVFIGVGILFGAYSVWKYRNAAELEKSVQKLSQENDRLKLIRTQLWGENQKFAAQNNILAYTTAQNIYTSQRLAHEVNRLEQANQQLHYETGKLSHIRKQLSTENKKFAASNRVLNGEITFLRTTTEKIRRDFQKENDTLKASNKTLHEEIDRLRSQLDRLDHQILTLQQTNEHFVSRLEKTTASLEKTETAFERLIADNPLFQSSDFGKELASNLEKVNQKLILLLQQDKLIEKLQFIHDEMERFARIQSDVAAKLASRDELILQLEKIKEELKQTSEQLAERNAELKKTDEDNKKTAALLAAAGQYLYQQVNPGKSDGRSQDIPSITDQQTRA